MQLCPRVYQPNPDLLFKVFLTPFAPARLLAPDKSRQPNPDCPVCSVYNTSLTLDLSRATLKDVVEGFVQQDLGLGEREFVLNNEVGILYDFDETANLPKKLTELGQLPHFLCATVC